MNAFFPRLMPLFLVALVAACQPPAEGLARGEAMFDTCAPCHGDVGQGDLVLGAPALAGADAWYLTSQLEKFQSGARGYHYQDAGGLRMRPMARSIAREGDVESLVEYIGTLPPANPAPTGHGDVQAGAQEYVVCSACHGVDGSGNEQMSAPSLLHLSDWYIENSVIKIRDGLRAGTPGDIGVTMVPMVMNLSDTQVANVAAYIQTLNP